MFLWFFSFKNCINILVYIIVIKLVVMGGDFSGTLYIFKFLLDFLFLKIDLI